jgi:lysophospholipase L1-like esterase
MRMVNSAWGGRGKRAATGLWALGLLWVNLGGMPGWAAETVVLRYGLLEATIPVADLQDYAATQRVSPALHNVLRFLSREDQSALRELLQAKLPADRVTLDRILNSPIGSKFLTQAGSALADGESIGVPALRSAAILGTANGELGPIGFLQAYPLPTVTLDLPQALKVIERESPKLPTDGLADRAWWQTWVAYQASDRRSHSVCLLGDSISAGFALAEPENRLPADWTNWAIGGMSSVSLVAQLQALVEAKVNCQTAILAIGTNDAWYTISDNAFQHNLTAAIALTRQMQTKNTILLPAFYSTVAASHKPDQAGPIARVEQINQLIKTVTETQQAGLKPGETLTLRLDAVAPLFEGQALNSALTGDGVHLNAAGLKLYRQGLLRLLKATN